MKKVLIGFSGNPEVTGEQSWQKYLRQKKNLVHGAAWGIGGTSVDWAVALKRLEAPVFSRLLLTVGDDPLRSMLTGALDREGIDYHVFPVLTFTNFGWIKRHPDVQFTKIDGIKGEYLSYPIDEVIQQVEIYDPASCVATGVTAQDIPLVTALFSNGGYHVLNPRDEAFADERINEVLPRTSLLIINDAEMSALLKVPYPTKPDQRLCEKIIAMGPDEVIVTCGKDGSYYANATGAFIYQKIVTCTGTMYDATGVGDTFAAAFFTKRMEEVSNEEALQFAACAASLKLTRINGGNSPHRTEVDQLYRTTYAAR